MADVTPFIDVSQFEAMFRPLGDGERLLAEVLLKAAAIRIRDRVAAAGRAPLEPDDAMAILVSFEVTRDAMPPIPEMAGRTQYSITTDDRTEQATMATAAGLLDFNERHWSLLGISATAGPEYGGMGGDFGQLGRANPYPIVIGSDADWLG